MQKRWNVEDLLAVAFGQPNGKCSSSCLVGAPSVVNRGGAVGATDLLKSLSEVFELDLSVPIAQLANQVKHHPLHWHLHMLLCVQVLSRPDSHAAAA